MIRKFVVFVIVIVSCLSGFSARAQQATPDYAVAFGYKNGIRVATIAADGTLTMDFIPGAYYQQGDVALVRALWDTDGRTLYYVIAPSDSPEQYRYIYAYDRLTKKKTPVVFLKQSIKVNYDFAVLDLAPQGRYLWLMRIVDGTARIIDTQAATDKRVSYDNEECPASALAWTEDTIYVSGFYACSGMVSIISVTTGKLIKSYRLEELDPYPISDWYPFASKPSSALSAASDNIYRIKQDGVETVSKGSHLVVSSDGKIAAFWNVGKLYQINPATGKADVLADAIEPSGTFATGNSVGFWTLKDKALRLLTISAEGKKSADFTLEAAGGELFASSDSAYAAVLYPAQNKVLMYGPEGKTFDSVTLPSDLRKTLRSPKEDERYWWKGWFFASVNENGVLGFAVNGNTGKILQPPQPQNSFAGSSPDGIWWLFACESTDEDDSPCGKRDKLLALNSETGKVLTLSDDVALNQRNFHFPPRDYYAWSPIVKSK